MQTKMIVLPNDDGFNVLIWGKGVPNSMRVRRFDNRSEMIHLLELLGVITTQEGEKLDAFTFLDSCPLYSPKDINEATLDQHGFQLVS